MHTSTYPELQIDQGKLLNNVTEIVNLCRKSDIQVAGVVKGVNGEMGVVDCFVAGGAGQIASSRIDQLKNSKQKHPTVETLLLRLPMHCELESVAQWSDLSLNSEKETLIRLNEACQKLGKSHGVILMMDLGDLREGDFNDEDLVKLAVFVEKELKYITLEGIGTNLGCYGAIKPTPINLGKLCDTAKTIESLINRKLRIVSGGATSSLPLLLEGNMPKGVNHLRIGEGILLNMDLPELWGVKFDKLHQDAFVLKAQIIEIKTKPSYPVGEIFIDAFGHTPEYEDRGVRKRAILGIGKQDFAMEDKLATADSEAFIVGSSSDHLIVDIEDCSKNYKVGDVMDFNIFYGPMLHLCTCPHVSKALINPIG